MHKGRKERTKKKKTQKLGVIECLCYHHLKRAHNATMMGEESSSRMAAGLMWKIVKLTGEEGAAKFNLSFFVYVCKKH